MKIKPMMIVQIAMGLIFLIFGLNGFLNFLPMPPMPEAAGAFMGALAHTGYMFPLIKAIEVVCGALLLTNSWVPLALILIAPNIVNIVFFHAFLAPSGLALPILLVAAEIALAWSHRQAFAPLFKRK